MNYRNIEKELQNQLEEPKISIDYRKEKSEHFGQIRIDLFVDMVMAQPEKNYTIEIDVDPDKENTIEIMQNILYFFENVDMYVEDDKKMYALKIRPKIVNFNYYAVHRRITIIYRWKEV